MNIEFKLETLGWLTCSFIQENTITIAHASEFGDKFQELLNAFFDLEEIKMTLINTSSHTYSIIWCDQINEFAWVISLSEDLAEFKIVIYEKLLENPSQNKVLIQFNIKTRDLFHQIYLSLDYLFQNFGLIGYKTIWEIGNFPTAEYIKLKSTFLNLTLPRFLTNSENEWKEKIKLDAELSVLNT
jgi:hypothetical protein